MSQALLLIRNYLYNPAELGWTRLWSGIGYLLIQAVFAVILALTHGIVILRSLYKVIDRVWLVLEKSFVVIALAVMTLAVFVVAFDRWIDAISLGWFWASKLALFLMIWVGFIGASIAVKERGHLTIDVAGRALSRRGARIANFFSNAISAGFCFVLAQPATSYMLEAKEFGDVEGVFPIPLWIVQLVMPLSLYVMGARFIENIFRASPEDELLLAEGKRLPPRLIHKLVSEPMAFKEVLLAGLFPGFLLGAFVVFWLGADPAWLILLSAVMMLIIGTPIFVLIGIAALLSVTIIGSGETISVAADMFGAVKKDVLLAIPFFILAGAIMSTGSIARRLIGMAKSLVAFVPGGMLAAAVVASLMFGAISGSAPVTVIAIGSIMFPALLKERYDENVSLGLVTTSGALGILIPPSIPMIIYAIMAPVNGRALSIRELFIAGVLPGFVVALVLSAYAIFKMPEARFHEPRDAGFKQIGAAFKEGFFAAILIGLIFIGIYVGLFTVVEASAVAVLYALLVEFVLQPSLSYLTRNKSGAKQRYRDFIELKFKQIPKIFVESSSMMGTIFLILVLAIAFNRFLTEEQIPNAAATWLSGMIDNKWTFLILVNIFLLIVGCIMDIMSATMIMAPLLAPIAIHYGIDPIHFGIIFIVNLSIGYITPPMGLNLFVASSVFDRPVTQVIKASFPYTVILLVALILVTYVPAFSLLLLGR